MLQLVMSQLLQRQLVLLLLVFLCSCQLVLAWENGLARTPVRRKITDVFIHPRTDRPQPLLSVLLQVLHLLRA